LNAHHTSNVENEGILGAIMQQISEHIGVNHCSKSASKLAAITAANQQAYWRQSLKQISEQICANHCSKPASILTAITVANQRAYWRQSL
jgi:type IV secretory pathway VirB2 component (pilin)